MATQHYTSVTSTLLICLIQKPQRSLFRDLYPPVAYIWCFSVMYFQCCFIHKKKRKCYFLLNESESVVLQKAEYRTLCVQEVRLWSASCWHETTFEKHEAFDWWCISIIWEKGVRATPVGGFICSKRKEWKSGCRVNRTVLLEWSASHYTCTACEYFISSTESNEVRTVSLGEKTLTRTVIVWVCG